MDEFKKFIHTLKYSNDIDPDELFVYAKRIGTGSDDDQFQCGFTSIKLLNRIKDFNDKGVYHLDATYKIIRHSFSLIVFGFTDLAREFYPVTFMFTSHETTLNYEFFFNKINNASAHFKLNFDPKYIVIDASHAMANAIKKIYPHCKIIMCWFHMKANIRKNKSKIPEHLYKQTLQEINNLHNTTCGGTYKVTKLFKF